MIFISKIHDCPKQNNRNVIVFWEIWLMLLGSFCCLVLGRFDWEICFVCYWNPTLSWIFVCVGFVEKQCALGTRHFLIYQFMSLLQLSTFEIKKIHQFENPSILPRIPPSIEILSFILKVRCQKWHSNCFFRSKKIRQNWENNKQTM